MGALPKRKLSKGRKNRRRSQDAISMPTLVPCPHCKSLKKPHAVCPNCGKYKDEEIVKTQ